MNEDANNERVPTADDAGRGDAFAIRHNRSILFFTVVLCAAGVYAAIHLPASVFPQTDFPRVVVLVDNGVMPANEMMVTVTRPIEESMKNIPGTATIRSATSRGAAEINVFFDWGTDMVQAELYVLSRLSQIRNSLPSTAETEVHRLTFTSFPVLGISLTGPDHTLMDLWEQARYEIQPRLLRIKGVARVKLVGGRTPEYHVLVDPDRLYGYGLSLEDVRSAIESTNAFVPAGMHEENRQLYLTVVDGRVSSSSELADVTLGWSQGSPVFVHDVATVKRAPEPQFNIVSADGEDAVLLNVYIQPDGNVMDVARSVDELLLVIENDLLPGSKLAFFYDQSLFVREGVRSVWESIIAGLALSVLVLYSFLRSVRATVVAVVAIPVTILLTLALMYAFDMSLNLMTLGGIAAAIGLIVDDAIVVTEAIHAKIHAGHAPRKAVRLAIREIGPALVGSTLTPVVVFIPLSFLDGVPGVFFRALATTMVSALLLSLVLALTLTPTLGAFLLLPPPAGTRRDEAEQGGFLLRWLVAVYERSVRWALDHNGFAVAAMILIAVLAGFLYRDLKSDFLPEQDEGAFVIDYFSRPGTSLAETDRMLRHVERILINTPEVESYSRRTGARLALAIAEPNTGDFLVKLKPERSQSTKEVIDGLRERIEQAEPALKTEFPGVLSDLIGDLTWSPDPVEIKIFSTNAEVIRSTAAAIAELISNIDGVVDVNDGLVVAGPSLAFDVRETEAARIGIRAAELGDALQTAFLGRIASYILEGDRRINIRVKLDPASYSSASEMGKLALRGSGGTIAYVEDLAKVHRRAGQLELHREDQRQLVAVSAQLSGLDLGSGIEAIKRELDRSLQLPANASIEYGGLYEQQQESFANLALVLFMAIGFVFGVLILEFRAILQPLAIVTGAILALFGVVAGLWITGTSLNIVSFLSVIIGVGIVAKNGILMLDYVEKLRRRGLSLVDALVQSGRRRLRPVLMTSLTAFLGLLPLAYGVGAGADMLRPLAIGIIGALTTSLLFSLVATPLTYFVLVRITSLVPRGEPHAS